MIGFDMTGIRFAYAANQARDRVLKGRDQNIELALTLVVGAMPWPELMGALAEMCDGDELYLTGNPYPHALGRPSLPIDHLRGVLIDGLSTVLWADREAASTDLLGRGIAEEEVAGILANIMQHHLYPWNDPSFNSVRAR